MVTDRFNAPSGVSRVLRTVASAFAVGIVGAAMSVATPAAAQNLVANPTFSITGGTNSFWFGGFSQWGGSESVAGWTYVPSGTTSSNNGAGFDFVSGAQFACYGGGTSCTTEQILPVAITTPTNGGGNFVAIDANWGGETQNSGVSQSITGLTVGTKYTLTFSYAATQWYNYTGSDSLAITAILGSASNTTSTVNVASQTFSGWSTATFTYVATAATETLQLLASGGSGQPPLALLANVSLTKAPEPMSIAIFGTGLVGLVAAARMRGAARRPA